MVLISLLSICANQSNGYGDYMDDLACFLNDSTFLLFALNQTLPISITNGRIIINWIKWFDSIERKPKLVKRRCEERVQKYLFHDTPYAFWRKKQTKKRFKGKRYCSCFLFFHSLFVVSDVVGLFAFTREIVKIIIRLFHLIREVR